MTQTMQRELFSTDEPRPMASGFFAEVVFDRPLDHVYTYGVSDALRDNLAVGKRVRVPFGKGDRLTTGYCVGVHETPPIRDVKEIHSILDDEPLLTDNLLRLTRWMADYYLCGWGQVLSAVVPAGAHDQAGTRERSFIEALPEDKWPSPKPKLTSKQQDALYQLRTVGHAIDMRQLQRLANCGSGPIESLVSKHVAQRVVKRVDSLLDTGDLPEQDEGPLRLNIEQKQVWQTLEPVLQDGGFHAFLLFGVTGSGKTEIYLRAIDEVLRQGKSALVLVPEISLTPQTIARFRGRFGEVAVLHSHLGDAERGSHWRRVATGQAQLIVGARSAVFAPARNLGLIVIDEEHENSFKQESTPRYHARDVAVMRARLESIPILLGSATPSLESWHNAQRGQYTLLKLPSRVEDRPMPKVTLIDRRNPESKEERFHALSDALERGMRDALKAGGQVMLLLNRRGFSTHIHCPACGYVDNCRFCDLTLTYHKARDLMLCHYCGYEQEPQRKCPKCDIATVKYQGLGTEKLQAEVEERFPGYVVRRMDSDTMKRPGSHAQLLDAFRNGLIHILLGTQMIAKGLDFPNVTLVGVVNADVGLHFPDFRSAERTFQLLSQVAGRTGRGPRGGRVIIQTLTPEHPAIALAATHDYDAFVAAEMAHRKAHRYPPYERMARIIVRSKNQLMAESFANTMAGTFAPVLEQSPEVRLLGPAEAPVFRLKGYYRFHFQLHSPSPGSLHHVLRKVMPTLRPPMGVEYTLDIDPFQMM